MMRWVLIALMLWTVPAHATVYFQSSLESVACNHEINNESVDGLFWNTVQDESPQAATPFPKVRCNGVSPATISAGTGAGSRYIELLTICTAGYTAGGRCAVANDGNQVSLAAGVQIGSSITSIVAGRTYYLGAFMRYDKVSSRDQWDDAGSPNNWDKTWEMTGTNFRWGVGVGWPQGIYPATNGKYTFDLWCADTAFVGCQVSGNIDHKFQNDNGYSLSTPFLADYGRWYAVVIKVLASTTTTGTAELYINGVRTTNHTGQVTYASGANIDRVEWWGTFSQSTYDRPASLIYVDNMLLTDSLTDVTNAGLMSDPGGAGPDTTPPSVPSGVTIVRSR